MTIKKILLGLSLLAAFQLNVSALDITYGGYGIGNWAPGNEFNNNAGVLEGVNHAVAIWNGQASTGVYQFGSKESAFFTKGTPSSVDGILPVAVTYEGRHEAVNGLSAIDISYFDNREGQFLYLTAKYGNDQQQVFYIGDLREEINLPTSIGQGGGLSHVAFFKGASVPDGGVTVMLLGLALAGVASVRRYLKS